MFGFSGKSVRPPKQGLDSALKTCVVKGTVVEELPNILTVRAKAKKANCALLERKAKSQCSNESKAYDAAIKGVRDTLAQAEENREFKKISQSYSEIKLDFLSMKRKPKKGECDRLGAVPIFSCHQIHAKSHILHPEGYKLQLAKSQICVQWRDREDAKKGEIWWYLDQCSSPLLSKAYSKSMLPSGVPCNEPLIFAHKALRTDKTRISTNLFLTHEFTGIIPDDTQKKIRKACKSEMFDEMYLIKEVPLWNVEEVTKDPLIIGIKGEKAYIIDHFDCTDLESYVKSEFSL
jgi:hypothetical protein